MVLLNLLEISWTKLYKMEVLGSRWSESQVTRSRNGSERKTLVGIDEDLAVEMVRELRRDTMQALLLLMPKEIAERCGRNVDGAICDVVCEVRIRTCTVPTDVEGLY